jgi:hypothetical protein
MYLKKGKENSKKKQILQRINRNKKNYHLIRKYKDKKERKFQK